jgi:subtilase family serine protease
MSKYKHRVWPGALAALLLLVTALIAAPLTHDTGAIAQIEIAPDLIVDSISWSPLPPSIGSEIVFTIAVRNLGWEPAGDYRLTLFIDDEPLKVVWVYGTEPGDTMVKTITWTARAGPHIVRAVADSETSIDESNESNNENSYAFSVLAPDMVVADISWVPENPNIGELVTFHIAVKNEGNKRSAASNVNLSIDGIFRGNRQIPCLEAGENETVTYNWVAATGTHEVEAFADYLTQVRESDEDNNRKVVTYATAAPDLVIDSITWSPQNRSQSDNVTMMVKVTNQGSGNSNYCWLYYYVDEYLVGKDFVDSIRTGASVTKSYNWAAGAGEYLFKAVIDGRQEVMENDEDNNTMAVTLPGILPDLVIENISLSTAKSKFFAGVVLTVVVKNKGLIPSGPCDLALYADECGPMRQKVPFIMAGQTLLVSFNYVPRSTTISLRAVIDGTYMVTESNDNNNSKTVNITPPVIVPNTDLTIESIGWTPAEPVLGDTVTITVNIKNSGEGETSTFHVAYYIDDAFIESVQADMIRAGGIIVNSVKWQAQPGRHTIRAVADANDVVEETNEANNERSVNFTVTAPDLAIQDVTWSPQNPEPGDEVEFTVTVINRGDEATSGSHLNYYIDDSFRGSHIIEGVEPGGTVTRSFTWRMQAGTIAFKVIIDEFDTVKESDEANNARTVFLPAADLIIEEITRAPEDYSENTSLTITIKVTNRGDGPARSPRVTGYVDDVFLTSIQLNDIGPNASDTGACVWNARNGMHTFRATADENNDIAETREDNNGRFMTLSVGQPTEEPDEEPATEEAAPSVTATNVDIIEMMLGDNTTSEPDIASTASAEIPWWQKILTNRLLIIGIGGVGVATLAVLVLLRRRVRRGKNEGEAA